MLINEILNTKIAALELDDTIAFALTKMNLMRTQKFGVIDEEERLAGMVSVQDLLEVGDESVKLSAVELEQPLFVSIDQHLFEAARRMLTHELYIMPVVDHDMKFHGIVDKKEVIAALSDVFNIATYGSVITIQLSRADFTLTDIIRIIETENAKILGVAVQQPNAENPSYRVSIKLNWEDSSVVSSALRRFGYDIVSEGSSESLEHNYADRADELIRYLDI